MTPETCSPPRHITIFFCATAGKQGDELGSDESQIILIVYLLYDVLNSKIATVQQHFVKPNCEEFTDNVLSDDCKLLTGLSEEAIKNAQPLDQVLDEMERFFKAKGIHPEFGGNLFSFCCDGPQTLRLALHAEAMQKNITLQSYFYNYYDLRKEFQKLYKRPASSIADMMEYLSLDADQSIDYGIKQVHDMATIIRRLLNDGHQFAEPEKIKDRLQPGICHKSDYVDDDTVIRARGLPWQSSDSDIARFFTGLNIAKGGVALCLSQQGRRNGEALIRFESKESRDLALKKHKHHLGNRYIEVYKATGKDFLNVAGGSNTEAQAFLSQGAQSIIRMRGLPYTATADQVLQFFADGDKSVNVHRGKDGIMFVHQIDGRATGDAFVLFGSEEDANIALSKHRELIGSRYIELFKSTTAEVQQVLNRTMEPQTRNTPPTDQLNFPTIGMNQMNPSIMSFLPNSSPQMPPTNLLSGHGVRDCIRLRGLPFEANVTDILGFLGEHSRNIVFQGVHMVYNAAGTPSGEAFIQMDSELAAEAAALNRHKKFMLLSGPTGTKKRYIEVFQCSSADMSIILTNPESPPVLPLAGAQLPTSPPINNGLHSTLNLTPPTLNAQISPQQCSPTSAPVIQPPQFMQPYISPRAPLLPTVATSTSAALLASYTNNLSSTIAAQPAALSQQMLSQLAQQQFLLNPQATLPNNPQRSAATVPGVYGPSPILYYYPSPPISPQGYFNAATAPVAGQAARGTEMLEQDHW